MRPTPILTGRRCRVKELANIMTFRRITGGDRKIIGVGGEHFSSNFADQLRAATRSARADVDSQVAEAGLDPARIRVVSVKPEITASTVEGDGSAEGLVTVTVVAAWRAWSLKALVRRAWSFLFRREAGLPDGAELRAALPGARKWTTFSARADRIANEYEGRGAPASSLEARVIMKDARESGLRWDPKRKKLRRRRIAQLVWPGTLFWAPLLAPAIAAVPLVLINWLWGSIDQNLLYIIAAQSISFAFAACVGLIGWAYRGRPNQPLEYWEFGPTLTVQLDSTTRDLIWQIKNRLVTDQGATGTG